MASIYFDDYAFPSELYERDTGDFHMTIRTLLDFTPQILRELPKEPKDRKPLRIHLETASFLQRNSKHVERFVHFLVDCCIEYFARTTTYHHDEQQYHYTRSSSSSSSHRSSSNTSTTTDKQKKKKDDEENEKDDDSKSNTMTKSAVAAGALGFSLYSTYQASTAWGHVNFQNQLERLLDHVSAALKSTSIWIKEREKMEDPVHDMIRQDVIRIRQLVHHVERLDSRSLRKKEATGWGMGVVGSLSAVGGIACGSMMVLSGGAVVALGGVLLTVATKGTAKSEEGARALLEAEVRRLLKDIEREGARRQKIVTEMLGSTESTTNSPLLSKNSVKQEPSFTSLKQKIPEA
ncbi:hypothetical protein RO3G_16663 [Lichtheimia corymbifera JMRC:FSU:9682]|uniref:Uncharacterized protein n=1 Tax=Lichtheimia corymbifera JMRC:FSU:9682 TaxID=1263082 RepID=A0A068RFA3_9FUNG|nr:hypothetical protein RO3G_16663 [Lichtheimia corymbifera JMRC:FSU:9682]